MKNNVLPWTSIKIPPVALWVIVLSMSLSQAACGNAGLTPTVASVPATLASAPTRTPGPSPTPANCLVGIWEVKDKEAYIRSAIPAGAFQPEELKYIGSVGSLGMSFQNDGQIAVEAQQFMGRFDLTQDNGVVPLDIQMNGYASGNYQLDGDQLKITGLNKSQMTYKATADQQDMMTETQADRFLPLFVAPYTVGTVDCTAETLTIKLLNFPNTQSPLVFKKLR
jgi:hypothetical protein